MTRRKQTLTQRTLLGQKAPRTRRKDNGTGIKENRSKKKAFTSAIVFWRETRQKTSQRSPDRRRRGQGERKGMKTDKEMIPLRKPGIAGKKLKELFSHGSSQINTDVKNKEKERWL